MIGSMHSHELEHPAGAQLCGGQNIWWSQHVMNMIHGAEQSDLVCVDLQRLSYQECLHFVKESALDSTVIR